MNSQSILVPKISTLPVHEPRARAIVRWLVRKQPVPASKAQIAAFTSLMGGHNNRPVQPVNARPVLQ